MPGLPLAVVKHPLGGISEAEALLKVDTALDAVVRELIRATDAPDGQDVMTARGPAARTLELDDDYPAINELYVERGWTDGLPIVPPTEGRVAEFLRQTSRDRREVVAILPPRQGEATIEKLAINAVMAGCRPEYFPVLLAAVEAVSQPPFNLDAVQATTHPVTPLLIVNGPIAKEIGLNGSYNAFGQGFRAERDHRPRASPGADERGRRAARQRRPIDAGQSREDRLLRRRERGGESVDAAVRRSGIRPEHEHGDGIPVRGPAQYPGSLQQYRPRDPPHHRRRDGAGRQQ